MVKDYAPATTQLSTGFLIKPTILERSKQARNAPTYSYIDHSGSVFIPSITGSNPMGYTLNTTYTGSLPIYSGSNPSDVSALEVGYTTITLKQGSSLSITPQTLNYLGTNSTFEASGYVATIGDSRTLSNFEGVGVNTSVVAVLNATQTVGTNVSRTVIGTTINLTATTVNTLFGSATTLNTILTVTGRD